MQAWTKSTLSLRVGQQMLDSATIPLKWEWVNTEWWSCLLNLRLIIILITNNDRQEGCDKGLFSWRRCVDALQHARLAHPCWNWYSTPSLREAKADPRKLEGWPNWEGAWPLLQPRALPHLAGKSSLQSFDRYTDHSHGRLNYPQRRPWWIWTDQEEMGNCNSSNCCHLCNLLLCLPPLGWL